MPFRKWKGKRHTRKTVTQRIFLQSVRVQCIRGTEPYMHVYMYIWTIREHGGLFVYCYEIDYEEPLLWFQGGAVSSPGCRLETQEIWWLCCLQMPETPRGQWGKFWYKGRRRWVSSSLKGTNSLFLVLLFYSGALCVAWMVPTHTRKHRPL